MLGYPPGADPPRPGTPQEQTPPWTRHPPRADTPPLDQARPRTRHPPPGSWLQHTVYERSVRILLECILVSNLRSTSVKSKYDMSQNGPIFQSLGSLLTYTTRSTLVTWYCPKVLCDTGEKINSIRDIIEHYGFYFLSQLCDNMTLSTVVYLDHLNCLWSLCEVWLPLMCGNVMDFRYADSGYLQKYFCNARPLCSLIKISLVPIALLC